MGDQFDELYSFSGSPPYLYFHLQVYLDFVLANKIG